MSKIIVVLSGGLDSTCVAAMAVRYAKTMEMDVEAVSFFYGQRHARELDAAQAVAQKLGIPHRTIDINGLLHGSALLGVMSVPEGHYASDNMAQTVVSGRNLLFASLAVAIADPDDEVWVGVHTGDHPIYADCRPEFWTALSALVGDAYGIKIVTPVNDLTKAEVLTSGLAAHAPVGLSWSCYNGGEQHCGRCGTCVERAEAFAIAGVEDPTLYDDADYWMEVVGR